MKRTLSIGSRVPPAVTSTRQAAASSRRARGAVAAALASERLARRQQPRRLGQAPDALLALGGQAPDVRLDDRARRARAASRRFACVAGCSYMRLFIAGATTSGQLAASAQLLSRLSASPCGELGDRVRRGRRDQEHVGVGDQLEVAERLVRRAAAGRGRRRARGRARTR